MDLNDLFRPLTFLNSLCQLTARQAHCPMDVLDLVSAWSKSLIVSPTLVIIKSLIMQGAEMSGTQLKETSRDAPEIVPMPPLVIGYSKVALSCKMNSLQLPVYRDATRRQFLFEIQLPIKEDADTWILSGVAIFLTQM